MSSVIRKISIGSDYKTDAMHYSLTQSVYGGHKIILITFTLKKTTRYCHGRNLILTWLYLLSMI